MANKLKVFALMFLAFSLGSCKEKAVSEESASVAESKPLWDSLFCENELALICADETMPAIELNLDSPKDSVHRIIKDAYDFDICDTLLHYGFPVDLRTKSFQLTEESLMLKLRHFESCRWSHGEGWKNVVVLMNYEALVLIQGNFVRELDQRVIDSLLVVEYLYNEFVINDDYRASSISVQWDKGLDTDELYPLIMSLTRGYLNMASVFSMEKFGKELCDLSTEELQEIRYFFPFELDMFNFDIIEPPLMPQPE